jgi:hypothetical protein
MHPGAFPGPCANAFDERMIRVALEDNRGEQWSIDRTAPLRAILGRISSVAATDGGVRKPNISEELRHTLEECGTEGGPIERIYPTFLDCFAGSGTTLVAAQALKRHWIGIDQSPHATSVVKPP